MDALLLVWPFGWTGLNRTRPPIGTHCKGERRPFARSCRALPSLPCWHMDALLPARSTIHSIVGEMFVFTVSGKTGTKRKVVQRDDGLLTPQQLQESWKEVQAARLKELKTWRELTISAVS